MIPLLIFGSTWKGNNIDAQSAVYAVLLIIAMVTMIVGNVAALSQTRMKRLLAYSSIGQAGYILLALASATYTNGNSIGLVAGLFHSASHAIMTAGAFICVIAITRVIKSDEIEDYKGLRKVLPKTSFALGIALLGLAGIPPLIGFFSKFFVFFAAVEAGNNTILGSGIAGMFYLGAFIGIITSAISVYYYVRVVKLMWVDSDEQEPSDKAKVTLPWNLSLPVFISVVIIFVISLAAGPLVQYLYWVSEKTLSGTMALILQTLF